jgi:hypothetical protein
MLHDEYGWSLTGTPKGFALPRGYVWVVFCAFAQSGFGLFSVIVGIAWRWSGVFALAYQDEDRDTQTPFPAKSAMPPGSKVESHFAGEEGNPLNPKGWYPCEITQVHPKSFGVKWISW